VVHNLSSIRDEGDSSDWDRRYEYLRPRLLRALIASLGTREGVEDCLQEAFLEAISRPPGHIESLEGWLFIVARNRHHRLRRRASRFLRLRSPVRDNDLESVIDRLDLVRALKRLSARDRNLVIAKYYLGLRQDELATTFSIPRGTVSAALSRALTRLRSEARHT
jgi:RNA polymerase sigma-70 factor (ECF subfamily)